MSELARARRLEPSLRAWAHLAPQPAGGGGALDGWPVGIKDLLDVRGMPTGGGAPAPDTDPAAADATVVARLRAAGATILGKTAATEYGWFAPTPSRNPWNPDHSPGGSSSGSAVAVAAGMCRAALGTQTAGSMIRPAAYTGVTALSATRGAFDGSGLVPVSPTLDTIGVFARTVADVASVAETIAGDETRARWAGAGVGALRLGVLERWSYALAAPPVRERVELALGALAEAGASVVTVDPDVDWSALARAHRTIMQREMAASRRERFTADPGHFSPHLREAIAAGLRIDDRDYERALAVRSEAGERLAEAVAPVDAWVTPAATSEPPAGDDPGDPALSVPFSLVGFPALAVPAGLTAGGLPAGLALVSGPWRDRALLDIGRRVEPALAPLRPKRWPDDG